MDNEGRTLVVSTKMETISIKSEEALSIEHIGRMLSQHWRVEISPSEIVVHGDKGRAYVHSDTETEQQKIRCLLVDYSDVELAKRLIGFIADNPEYTVNNDFGTILPGDEFVARCKAEPHWDWRR